MTRGSKSVNNVQIIIATEIDRIDRRLLILRFSHK